MTATLGFDTYGPADAPALVVGAALGTTHSTWRHLISQLSGEYRVIAYEHRGHGRSDLPAGTPEIADLGQDVLALLDRLSVPSFHYVGTSLGGLVGLWLAANQPARVASLGLVGVAAHLPPAQAWWDRAALVRTDGTKALSALLAGKWFSDDFRATHPATVAEVLGEVEATPAEGYAACSEAVATMDLRAALPGIAVPSAVIVGSDDPSTPPEQCQLVADRIPGARLHVLPGARHLAGVERADEVTDLLAAHIAQARVR